MVKDVVLIIFLLICAGTDLKERLVYNRVILPAVVFGLLYAFLSDGIDGVRLSLEGMLLGVVLLLLPFYLGGVGAGDVKMLAAIGAIEGPYFTLHAFFISALVGGVWAFAYLARRGKVLVILKTFFWNVYLLLQGFPLKGLSNSFNAGIEGTLPYGAVLALGTFLTYVSR
ncbi:A24 family peptidase [Moorella sulfitireducens]|uniref:A24 family peptidase n=1 Tax=Neomoorella sulfitireducens TaxID=2972948 RepID=UPI0021AC7D69